MIFAIVSNNVSSHQVMILENIVRKYGRHIRILVANDIDKTLQELNVPKMYGKSYAPYYKLFINRLIDVNVDVLLYLDSDTIITGNLSGLINKDLGDNILGMVCDSVIVDKVLPNGCTLENGYYNSGVLLINYKKYSNPKVSEMIFNELQMFDYNLYVKHKIHDQDLINFIFRGSIVRIQMMYNFQPIHAIISAHHFLNCYKPINYYTKEQITESSSHPVILHCLRIFGQRPWDYKSKHPFTEEYEKYRMMSNLPDEPDKQSTPIKFKVERMLFKLLPDAIFIRIFRYFQLRIHDV